MDIVYILNITYLLSIIIALKKRTVCGQCDILLKVMLVSVLSIIYIPCFAKIKNSWPSVPCVPAPSF